MEVDEEQKEKEEYRAKRAEVLGFKPQREIVYNRLLPYADKIDDESNEALRTIKTNLAKAVLAKEIRPSVTHWTKQLSRYIRLYSLKFSKEDHLLFIKLYLELLLNPDTEGSLLEIYSIMIFKLLKKQYALSREDLVIEWRPLYELCERVLSSKYEAMGLEWFPNMIEQNFKQVIGVCRTYFRPEATQEMLDEWRPLLCPFDITVIKGLKYMELFLPTLFITEPERNTSWRLWFNEMIAFWESIHNGPVWEFVFVSLFSRLARNNIGLIDWEPHASKILTRILRNFRLPVGKLNHTAKSSVPSQVDSVSQWIVSMMGGSSTKKILQQLKSMFEAIESYYHPSNYGKWTLTLLNFLHCLTAKFIKRLHRERYRKERWFPKIPESSHIADEDITTFVNILKPVTFLALYSKMGTTQACRVIQNLVMLRPELIFPELLEKTYVALETLTEPHQLRSCLSALTFTLRMIMRDSTWYSEGRRHIIPILIRVIPAIDSNDLPKSLMGFQFISTCLTLLPVVDCSDQIPNHPELTEDEKELCYATSQFNDFVLQLLDRIFTLTESLNQEHSSQQQERGSEEDGKFSSHDAVIVSGVSSALAVLMIQSSDEIYKLCLEKIFHFATTHLLDGPIAMAGATKMCAAAAKANPAEASKKFIPYCCRIVTEAFQENPELHKDEKIDKKVLWNLAILSNVCKYSGDCLLSYKDEIFEVLELTQRLEAKQGYEKAARLMRECLFTLSTFIERERLSVDPGEAKEDSYLPINDWGKTITTWKLKMSWHEPSEEEIRMSFDIIDTFLLPQLETLKNFTEGTQKLTKDELLQCLTIIYQITVGAVQLLPIADEELVEIPGRDEMVNLKSWKVYTISYTQQYRDVIESLGEKALGLRRHIFETARKALWFIMDTMEDDVKCISKIIAIYSECLMFHELYKNEYDNHWKIFSNGKKAMQDILHKNKQHQRLVLIDRIVLQHQLRTLTFDRSTYDIIQHNAMIDLLKLSISHYSEVRIAAQRVFFRGLALMPLKSHEHYLPLVLENLFKDPVANHKQLKGALHLLHGAGGKGPSFLSYMHRWDVIARTWPALIGARFSDKSSIVKIYSKITQKIQSSYNTIAIHQKISQRSLEAAKSLLQSSSYPHALTELKLCKVEEKLAQRIGENLRYYEKLTADIMDLLEKENLSWRHSNHASNLLLLLLRWDAPLNPRVVRYFTSGLIDDTIQKRRMCFTAVAAILKKQERKRKVIMMTPEEISGIPVPEGPVSPGERPDNLWFQYDSLKVPRTREEYDSTIFIEKTHWGYYQWPKKLKTYMLHDESYKLGRTREELPEDEREIFDKFSDPNFVDQFIKLASLEFIKGKDRYSIKKVELYKGLFRNFSDAFLNLFRHHLERLSQDKQESSQRCVAEIVAGLVMGTKHWNFDRVQNLWEWLIPVLRTTVENISVETVKDWDQAYSHMVQNRDPRKIHWLLDFLFDDPVSGKGGSFMDASRLFLLQGGIHQQECRVSELLHQLLEHIEPKLDHQYKNVRDRIGSVLASVFYYDIKLLGKDHLRLTPRRDEMIDRVLLRLTPLSQEDALHISSKSSDTDIKCATSRVQEFSLPEMMVDVGMPTAASASMETDNMIDAISDMPESILQEIQENFQKMMSSEQDLSGQAKEVFMKYQQFLPPGISVEAVMNTVSRPRSQLKMQAADIRDSEPSTSDDSGATSGADEERTSAVRLLKTLMKWIISAQRGSLQPMVPSMLKLLPMICKMSPADTQGSDEELHHDTQVSLACLAQSYTPPGDIDITVKVIRQISQCTSWHARHTILKFSQIFIFNNLFLLQERQDCVDELSDVILCLIGDEQLEVREMAATTLSGLLQCGFVTINRQLEEFINKHCKVRVKGHKRRKTSEAKALEEDIKDTQLSIKNRHAGVLALSACILASPYTIPEYFPDLLMKLSNHLHDPQPIEATVKKTFSEFRRTHHDSWHQDKMKFTSDQLSVLTDLLVSPCYYA